MRGGVAVVPGDCVVRRPGRGDAPKEDLSCRIADLLFIAASTQGNPWHFHLH